MLIFFTMYESVDVVGLTPSPNPFLSMDYYHQNRGCLIPEKGLVSGGSRGFRTPHWSGSNHCRWPFVFFILNGLWSNIMRTISFRVPPWMFGGVTGALAGATATRQLMCVGIFQHVGRVSNLVSSLPRQLLVHFNIAHICACFDRIRINLAVFQQALPWY